MAGGVLLTVMVAAFLALWHPAEWPAVLPLLSLWALAPAIARRASRPGSSRREVPLTDDERRTLRLIARRTWSFFSTFVTSESHDLPPDNFQETPQPVVAQRTSPTNIGLYLLSVVSARDFGWIGTLDLVDRVEATLRTVHSLEHHRGHLYNWYDTHDCHALDPKYVSSVDSGNLAGALITLADALREMAGEASAGQAVLSGIGDAALLVARRGARRGTFAPAQPARLDDALDVVLTILAARPESPADWAARMAELQTAAKVAADCAREPAEAGAANPTTVLGTAALALRETVASHARDFDTLYRRARVDRRRGGRAHRAAARDRRGRTRDGHGDGVRVPLRPDADALRDRVSPERREPRRRPLRPARLGGTPAELRRDREGRRADAALVPPRAAADAGGQGLGAAVVVGVDVRVPDAGADHARADRKPARADLPPGGTAADRVRGGARRAVGNVGVRVQRRATSR